MRYMKCLYRIHGQKLPLLRQRFGATKLRGPTAPFDPCGVGCGLLGLLLLLHVLGEPATLFVVELLA